jgi:glycosyltransferase involved in cell wall biosynthesis
LEVGGGERQLIELAKGLHERGHPVRIGLSYRIGGLLADVEGTGIEILDFGKTGRWDIPGFLRRAVAAIRSADPDIIYSFLAGGNLVAAAVRPFVRKPRYVWSVRASNMDRSKYGWVSRFGRMAESLASNLPDLIIANSSAGARFAVRNGFPAGKIVVVPNGIDTARFRPDAKARAADRKRLGLRAEEIAVGVLARLDPMKGHPIFLRAAAIAAPRMPALRFICVGSGPDLQPLSQLAEELGLADRVVLAGERNPVAALNAFDIACSCSVWGEGFSNAIAEAMACGLPCIVTDVGDSAMIVGNTGTVVPLGSPEALAEAILAQAASLDRHDRRVPRARIVENFSISEMVERTLDAFHQRLGI